MQHAQGLPAKLCCSRPSPSVWKAPQAEAEHFEVRAEHAGFGRASHVFHSTTARFEWEGTLKTIISQPSATGRDTSRWIRLPEAPSNLVMSLWRLRDYSDCLLWLCCLRDTPSTPSLAQADEFPSTQGWLEPRSALPSWP